MGSHKKLPWWQLSPQYLSIIYSRAYSVSASVTDVWHADVPHLNKMVLSRRTA